MPVYFKTVPQDRLNAYVTNQLANFNGYALGYCKKKCGGDNSSEACMAQCQDFVQRCVTDGFEMIQKVHKEYTYTKLGEEE